MILEILDRYFSKCHLYSSIKNRIENVYHNGEKAIQELLGESENAVRFGRGIKPTLTGKAMHFIQKQLIALVSSTDEKAQLWASILILSLIHI